MPETAKPSDLGLSEFLTKLVTDSSEAFLVAQQHQQSYYAELESAAILAPGDFAKAIPESEVDRELATLFPSSDRDRPTAVFVGAPYRAPVGGGVEDPSLEQTLGIRLAAAPAPDRPGDGKIERKANVPADPTGSVLTAPQVQLIREATRKQVAARRQAELTAVLSQPRVRLVVDSARITAKVELGAQSDGSAPPGPAGNAPATRASASLQNLLKSPSPLRLNVRMANAGTPQASGLPVDIYSEIEITLKSIVL
jgi:hypothetical protein